MSRTLSAEIQAVLQTRREFHIGYVLSIRLESDEKFNWSAEDYEVVNGSTKWSLGPLIDIGEITFSMGLDDDVAEIEVTDNEKVYVSGYPLSEALVRGYFDGAEIAIHRVISESPGQPKPPIDFNYWIGRVGAIEGLPPRFTIQGFTPKALLNQPIPRNVYEPGCDHTLYEPDCGLDKANFLSTGTVSGVSFEVYNAFTASIANHVDNYFALGTVKFLTGKNKGFTRTIKSSSSGRLEFMRPWPGDFNYGDTFEISPGCDRQMSTCKNKFDNLGSFAGIPFIPAPETTT